MIFARTLLAICLLTSPRYLRASDVPTDPATDPAATDDVTALDSETSSDDPTVGATDATEPEPDTSSDDTTLDTEDTTNNEVTTREASPDGDVTTNTENPADDASTSQTSGTTPEDGPNGDNISSGTSGNYSNDECIEVTIPNILGIEATLIEGVLLLVNCTVIGVFKNLTPMTALKTVKDVLVALLKKILPSVAKVLEAISMLSVDGKIKDKTCRGPIKIGFPSSLGKCMDNTLKLCENGETVDESIITSLLSTIGCTLETVLTTAPNDLLSIVLCDIAKAMAAVFGNFFGTGELISQLAAATCPKS